MDLHSYDEDIIIKLRDELDKLKGMILLDYHGDMFTLTDYQIESITYKVGFWKKKEKTEFYIKSINLSSGTKDYYHENDDLCSFYGVTTLMDYHLRWTDLQKKLIKFSMDTGIPLNFSSMHTSK